MAVKGLTSLMKTAKMITVTIPHAKLMKWLILCSNPPSPYLLGTQQIPRLQIVGLLTLCTSLSSMEKKRGQRSGCAKYVGKSWLNTPMIALINCGILASKVPQGVANYVYGIGTGYLNLQKHLAGQHAAAYNKAIVTVENNWNYCLSSVVKSDKSNTVEAHKHFLPLFTQGSFIDYIIHFVIANDQVSNMFSVTNLCPHLYLVDLGC